MTGVPDGIRTLVLSITDYTEKEFLFIKNNVKKTSMNNAYMYKFYINQNLKRNRHQLKEWVMLDENG